MNIRRCLRTAERIRTHFQQEVGLPIDPYRMLGDEAYARDVLVVCDANPRSELATLAQHFRLAAAEPAAAHATVGSTDSSWGTHSSSFATSRSPAGSGHSAFEQERQAVRAARRAPGWMSPGRWLGSDT